jgi:23S rRNA (guanosine2251-2'-O)-methyltransferase
MTRARGPAKPSKSRERPARRPRGGGPAAAKSPRAQPASAPSGGKPKGLWLYGRHAVAAALANPSRSCHRLLATAEGLAALGAAARRPGLEVAVVEREEVERRLGAGAVHQGVALSVAPLPRVELRRACAPEPGRNLVLLLDQVTDPHNVGAILRSAAAFEVRAVVLPARGSAELGGALAKAASGALDVVPVVEVVNLARALDELAGLGYWRIALDGHAEGTLDEVPDDRNLVMALGAEGTGLRRLVAERCDFAARLPIAPAVESLNVSVACGIALYALARRHGAAGGLVRPRGEAGGTSA